MRTSPTRRSIREPVKRSLRRRGFADASTRKGAEPQTFHIDGKVLIGRGTVSADPVDVHTLRRIQHEVYSLDRMRHKVKIHVAHGGYTSGARSFAREHGIRLYALTSAGKLRRLGRGPVLAGRSLDRIVLWAATVGLMLGAVVSTVTWAAANTQTVSTIAIVVVAVVVGVPLLILLGSVLDLLGSPSRRR